MVAAQHVESQVALYLFVMLPLPKDELLSSLFFLFFFAFTFISPPLLNCFKLQIEHVSLLHICILISLVVLTLHTSASNLLLICCTCAETHKKRILITNNVFFSVIALQFYLTTDIYTEKKNTSKSIFWGHKLSNTAWTLSWRLLSCRLSVIHQYMNSGRIIISFTFTAKIKPLPVDRIFTKINKSWRLSWASDCTFLGKLIKFSHWPLLKSLMTKTPWVTLRLFSYWCKALLLHHKTVH